MRIGNWQLEDGSMAYPLDYYGAHKQLPWDPPRNLVAYCIEEARRQQDTVWHGWRLYDAWIWAQEYQNSLDDNLEPPLLTHAVVREIGRRIDELNHEGYRTYPIWVGGESRGHHDIHARMSDLLDQQLTLDPDIFYYTFELIHPFGDGNGRTGKVLFNYLNDTMSNPVWPTDFFGGIQNP